LPSGVWKTFRQQKETAATPSNGSFSFIGKWIS
jgi:hypothetical protein